MTIEGLRNAPSLPQVNITDAVGASVEALDRLDLVNDRERVVETVTADFELINSSGVTGESFVQIPQRLVKLSGLVETLDAGPYPGRDYPATYIYHALWTPGNNANGYKDEELGNLEGDETAVWQPHARLAVHNPDSKDEPLLHFLGQPYDAKYAEQGQETQLEAIAKAKQAYESEHEGFNMTPLNANAVAMIALIRRIKGEAMPMEWGFMRDATLPRKFVGGVSFVGDVYSRYGKLKLNDSNGNANPNNGV